MLKSLIKVFFPEESLLNSQLTQLSGLVVVVGGS